MLISLVQPFDSRHGDKSFSQTKIRKMCVCVCECSCAVGYVEIQLMLWRKYAISVRMLQIDRCQCSDDSAQSSTEVGSLTIENSLILRYSYRMREKKAFHDQGYNGHTLSMCVC